MLKVLDTIPLFRRLGVQLSMLMAALVALSLGLFGLFAYQIAHSSLEDELGKRLITAASIGAGILGYEDLEALTPRGKVYAKIEIAMKDLAKKASLERVILFDVSRRVMADSQGHLKWGDTYHPLKLDLVEWRWALQGEAVETPLFGGKGNKMFKSALAPVVGIQGEAVAVLRVEADAEFLAVVKTLAYSMLAFGALSLLLALILAAWVSRPVVGPIRELISAAKQIARGDFDVVVSDQGRGEVGEAARTFNAMTQQLGAFVKEKERMASLGELSAGVAHEIRNPLAAIEGFAGLLDKKLEIGDKRKTYAKDILTEVRILNRFITN